jgi:release factor glutamine methyltransferase
MTYDEIKKLLFKAGIEDSGYEAALLVEKFCGIRQSDIPLLRGRSFSNPGLEAAVKRRTERCPLQYILGEWGFCGETYEVSPACLIPRPDTELLVETAAELIPANGNFIDAGTGSGCVSISLLALRPDLTGTAFDISPEALAIAGRNSARNKTADRLTLKNGDMLDQNFWNTAGKFDAVVSNPPYIPGDEIAGLEPELCHEPLLALFGGPDGLDFYRSIIKYAGAALKDGGIMLLEVGFGEADGVSAIAKAGGYCAETLNDIEGRGRVVVLRKNR